MTKCFTTRTGKVVCDNNKTATKYDDSKVKCSNRKGTYRKPPCKGGAKKVIKAKPPKAPPMKKAEEKQKERNKRQEKLQKRLDKIDDFTVTEVRKAVKRLAKRRSGLTDAEIDSRRKNVLVSLLKKVVRSSYPMIMADGSLKKLKKLKKPKKKKS